ncbi:MAG TPA: hypothetical protein VHO69_04145 [Phototrophicaceae bacterium]|nr:hypothetical protein [Phototrophicaceae bacterium]
MKHCRIIIFIFMLVAGLAACATEPAPAATQLSPTQVEQTVQALVRQRMTEAVPTPDVEATVSARLTAIAGDAPGGVSTPAPAQPPVLTPVSTTPEAGSDWVADVGKALGDFINTVVTAATSAFNSLAQTTEHLTLVVGLALCCGLPLLVFLVSLVSKLFDG